MDAIRNEIKNELARRELLYFAAATDSNYRAGWHHRALCAHLDRFAAKEAKRLMVFMPPRHGKSELASRKLPAFIFGRDPDASIITVSYSADLAQRNNRDVQRIMDSAEYGKIFPGSRLYGRGARGSGTYLRNSDIFEIVGRRGVYRSAGVGGGITGMGGDYIIIDDPVKNRADAESATMRSRIWEWYSSTLYTRLEKNGAIALIMTRWHEDDLAGRLLQLARENAGADRWEVLNLPGVAEAERHRDDTRGEGQALWESKYPLEALNRIKASIGSYDWSALYQQRPAPSSGGLFKREWWQRWRQVPGDLFDCIQSWDCAFKDAGTSDYVVGQVWARSKKQPADRYLLDQVRARMTFTETVQAVRGLSAKWPKAVRKLIEDKANGTAVIDVLKKEVPGLVPVEPMGGKVVRAHAVTAVVEAGNVFIPDASIAPWAHDFIEELSSFPSGAHDDQVDAMTQANAYYNDKGKFNIRNLT